MSLGAFVLELSTRGRARVPRALAWDATHLAGLSATLGDVDAQWRHQLAGEVPALEVAAACWAAELCYRACQFAAYPELGREVMADVFRTPCPQAPGPAVAYSVDLMLRFLPDIGTLARGRSPADPLLAHLRELGRAWPLSSVGMDVSPPFDISTFIDHPALRTLYVDRVVARGDRARRADPRLHPWLELAA
jgi:hypothetical protein